MRQGFNLNLQSDLSGWTLIEARLGRHCQYTFPSLSIKRQSTPNCLEEIPLPILADGWIFELVELPDDVAELICRLPQDERPREPGISLKRVGRFERSVHMAYRVAGTLADLSRSRRNELGLSFLSTVLNLPRAYRLATQYGPRLQAEPYPAWSERFDALTDRDRNLILAHIARFAARPRFHVLVAVGDPEADAVRITLESLNRQLYRDFTCTILGKTGGVEECIGTGTQAEDAGRQPRVVMQDAAVNWLAAFNASLASEWAGDCVLLLRAGDTLPEHSLYWFASQILARPDAAILYSDDDTLNGEGRLCVPRFKPDWSLAHLCSTNYIGDAVVVRGGAVAAAGGLTSDCLRHGSYDLLLRVIDAVGEKVAHIPAVLLHRRAPAQVPSTTPRDVPLTLALSPKGGEGSLEMTSRDEDQGAPHNPVEGTWDDPRWCVEKLREHLKRRGVEAEVSETLTGCRRVRYGLPETPPLVSIIVPTRDRVALLRQCVESVLAKSTYPRFEILVVDNRSAETETLTYLGELAGCSKVRVLRYERPFNFSAINNFAAGQARGEMLCLLNNDTEVISPDWLEEMAGHLLQERVGAVGARLLYTDGRVQHGGVTVGPGGCADHLHTELPGVHPGYCRRAVIAQELSAVTAACMLTWKHLYDQLGGFDEKNLPVAFNDVDYCLRLQEAGCKIVYTPHAELYHHESASRGVDSTWSERRRSRREVKYMRRRWRERMKHDPYYNPNLSYEQPNFTLNWKPRIAKPWRQARRQR